MTEKRHKKIMILYASYGDGHYQVAKALSEKFREYGGHDIVMVDLFRQANPTVNAITKYFYIKSYKVMPAVYGWLYYGTKHMKWHSFFARWLQSYGVQTMMGMLHEGRPDVVIHTFPMSVAPEVCKRTGYDVPSVTIVTDFDLHRRWLHPGIDRYYVATSDLKAKFVQAGISGERVTVSGIPVRLAFDRLTSNDESIVDDYGLQRTKHSVLIMAGAYGVTQGIAEMCERLAHMDGVQFIVVCGRNNMLKEEMEEKFRDRPHVRILGYVEHIDELMRISTCIITKPGGITLSEAIAMRLPILIYRPVPGQERDNAIYLSNRGAALISYDPMELAMHVTRLLRDPEYLEQMQQALSSLRVPGSASMIVHDILTYLDDRERVAWQEV